MDSEDVLIAFDAIENVLIAIVDKVGTSNKIESELGVLRIALKQVQQGVLIDQTIQMCRNVE